MGRTPRTFFLSSFLACRSASEMGLAASQRLVKMTKLVGSLWQDAGDRIADGMLTISDHSRDGDLAFLADVGRLLQQWDQILFCGSQQAVC